MSGALPTVIVPVRDAPGSLDACLAALERTLPAGASVLLADDASGDPQVEPLARGWCSRSSLDARYQRSERSRGLAATCNAAIADAGAADVVLLQPDAVATPGWLQQLTRCVQADARIGSAGVWSNHADLASFPRMGEENPPPRIPELIAEAAASIAWDSPPDLPAAVGPCLYLRRAALRQVGDLDAQSLPGERAFDDLCRRAVAMGWRHVLCPGAFVIREGGSAGAPLAGDEMSRLLARWPDYQEQVARFIMSDPLRACRERLLARMDELSRSGPQRDLFN